VLARQRGATRRRTCRQLVSAVLTVGDAVAKSALVDTFGGALRTALRAVELVVRAGDCGTVVLVGAVGAVLVTVATPPDRNTTVVLAPELTAVTWREIAVLFI